MPLVPYPLSPNHSSQFTPLVTSRIYFEFLWMRKIAFFCRWELPNRYLPYLNLVPMNRQPFYYWYRIYTYWYTENYSRSRPDSRVLLLRKPYYSKQIRIAANRDPAQRIGFHYRYHHSFCRIWFYKQLITVEEFTLKKRVKIFFIANSESTKLQKVWNNPNKILSLNFSHIRWSEFFQAFPKLFSQWDLETKINFVCILLQRS